MRIIFGKPKGRNRLENVGVDSGKWAVRMWRGFR
jgi:hypothetical protein